MRAPVERPLQEFAFRNAHRRTRLVAGIRILDAHRRTPLVAGIRILDVHRRPPPVAPAPLPAAVGTLHAFSWEMGNVPLGSYRRNLPHWRLTGAAYFVTFRLHERQPYLGSQDRTLVAEILRRRDGRDYRLDAFVVMNDHVHTLVVPSEGQDLSRILHAWKSVSARDLQRLTGRTGSVWQREYFDRIIRDESEWFEKLRYIAANPYRRWPELSEYAWVHPALR